MVGAIATIVLIRIAIIRQGPDHSKDHCDESATQVGVAPHTHCVCRHGASCSGAGCHHALHRGAAGVNETLASYPLMDCPDCECVGALGASHADGDPDDRPCTHVLVGRRSGAGIHGALRAWAYLEYNGERFCGVCGKGGFQSDHDNEMADEEQRVLLRVLGLHDAVPLQPPSCPDAPVDHTVVMVAGRKWKGKDWNTLIENVDTYFTTQWLEKARALTPHRPPKLHKFLPKQSVVIHVRRGDVTSDNRWQRRYLPNEWFITQLRRHRGPMSECTVFSEKFSDPQRTETEFADFVREGCRLELSGPMENLWRAAIRSDVYIMSRSSFSYVPGIFTKGTTVFPHDMWHDPMPFWHIADTFYNGTGWRTPFERSSTLGRSL